MKLVPNQMRSASFSDDREQRADGRPEQGIHAAGDRGEDDLQRHRHARHDLRVEIQDVLRSSAPPTAVSAALMHRDPQFLAHAH